MTSPESPLVSVIISCYNQARFLPEAVDSALAQTHVPCEVVVIDDGSTDETPELQHAYPSVKWVRQVNRGISEARNRGITESSGSYLLFLDSDDRLLPRGIELSLEQFARTPDCHVVAGRSTLIDTHGRGLPTRQPPLPAEDPYATFLKWNVIWMPGAVLYRRAALEAIGGFDRDRAPAEDYHMYLRASRLLTVRLHDGIIAEYRRHDGQVSKKAALMLRATFDALGMEWPHVAADPRLRKAWRQGRRHCQDFYGERVVEELRDRLHGRQRWNGGVSLLWTLLRYYPGGVARHVGRQIKVAAGDVRRRLAGGRRSGWERAGAEPDTASDAAD
jgi:glycosyltransferase involved in cell wall biosynthesis